MNYAGIILFIPSYIPVAAPWRQPLERRSLRDDEGCSRYEVVRYGD